LAVEPHRDPSRDEGLFDDQLALSLPAERGPLLHPHVRLRDGSEAPFDRKQVADAIFEAAQAVGGEDRDMADSLAVAVEIYLAKRYLSAGAPTVDHVHDAVERVLIQMSHARTALAYARRRDRRARIRRLREGDLRTLLTELDEVRFEREAKDAQADPGLFGAGSEGQPSAWDRAAAARLLANDTDLTPEQAVAVATAVERQIIQAGIRQITPGLVRELLGAELLERGWRKEQQQVAALPLPLDALERVLLGRTPETVAQHPGAADHALGQTLRREYALSHALPPAVAEAHLRGDLHIDQLGGFGRFDGMTHALAHLALHGVQGPGGRLIAASAQHGDTLLAHLVKWDELIRHYSTGPQRWGAVNVYFAPFLLGLEEPELRQFAQMLLYEFAYRALSAALPGPVSEVEVVWSVPQALRGLHIAGPGGETMEDTYGQFEHTAQQFAWALIEEITSAAEQGAPLPAPAVAVTLEGPCLRAPGQNRFIAMLGKAAAAGAPFTVRFAREPESKTNHDWNASAVTLPPVVLNLARAAYIAAAASPANPLAAFDAEVERVLSHAVQAHKAQRAFIESLSTDAASPLGLVTWTASGEPYIALAKVASPIAVDGLREAVLSLTGEALGGSPEATQHAAALLHRLRERCAFFAQREGFPITLTENTHAEISHRLATVDLALYPEAARQVLRADGADAPLAYTLGAGLPADAPLNPWERAVLDSQLKGWLHEAAPVRVALPDGNMSAESLASFITRLYRDSACQSATFDKA
jgi:ribonucleoside-triphosphate reductase